MEPLEETKDDDEEDSLPETEDDEEEENSVPDHHLDITTSERKSGKMKGVTREKVSLTIGNYLFRKRRVAADGGVFFSCNGCETQASKYLSAIAKIKEDGSYELIEWPRLKDHSCWADGYQALVKKARRTMIFEVSQDPSRSVNQIYEEVRNSITQTMTTQEKQLFLSAFPTFRAIQSTLYKKRWELLPSS